uniref:VQ domain-containing protein n=1 Tax=Oryza punctata TaxID=4537 RepID=A0A0E0KJY7_ORYPU
MTMTVAMPSSSSSRRGGLRGPRPLPLKVSSSSRGSSPSSSSAAAGSKGASKKAAAAAAAPVIVYEHTPKVVHARPQEFMTVVQRLTGKPSAPPPLVMPVYDAPAMVEQGGAAACGAGDPLLLTLGQRQAAAPALAQPPAVPSPMMAAGMLLSPGFIFSPNTMQSIQELSPLF